MRLRLAQLLKEQGITAYELAKRSDGRISESAAYRLASDDWAQLPRATIDAICEVLGIEDPGPLFEREKRRR